MEERHSAALNAATSRPAPASHPPLSLPLLGQCVASLNDIIVITEAEPLDAPGPRIVYVNEAFQRQTGYRPEEVLGRSPRFLQGPKTDQTELRRIGHALRRWEVVRAELINYTKDGREFHVEMDIVPVADATGWYTHWIAVQRNVTARKLAERQAQMREAQRVESLGALAAGIAHDFNNIVATILGNVAIARQDIAAGQSGLASLDQIHTAGIRARDAIQRILGYSRRQPQAFVRERLGAIVLESTDLLRSALPAGIELTVALCDEPIELLADAAQLQQVLLNIGTNAWHAMQGGRGSITVECSRLDMAAPRAASAIGPAGLPAAGRHAVIRVSDNGCGMDAATCARIFEPYFTTKALGQGTGLGLFAAAGIVEAHGGSIAVESVPGAGTTFSLVFPLLTDTSAGPDVAAPAPPSRTDGRGERVMIVDDDEMVLLMLGTMLVRSGFRVSPFNDPVVALKTLKQRPADFDIVVTDQTMPALSGLQLTREIVTDCPALPVVIASGYLDDALRTAAAEAGASAVVGKEFTASELSGLLQTVLKGRAAMWTAVSTAVPASA